MVFVKIYKVMERNQCGVLGVLFDRYYENLVLFAESYVGDLETAEDMIQDVFLSLLSHSNLDQIEYTRSYLYSCVKNSCVDYLRKLKVVDPLDLKVCDAVYYTGDFDIFEQEKLICRLEEEIENLPEQRRDVLKMSVYKKMSYLQIAEVMHISVNTVKTHMKKAYQELRVRLVDQRLNLFLFIVSQKIKERFIC